MYPMRLCGMPLCWPWSPSRRKAVSYTHLDVYKIQALAALVPQLEETGLEPQLDFADKTAAVLADQEALGRVLRLSRIHI